MPRSYDEAMVRYPECRSAVFAPSNYEASEDDGDPPVCSLQLEFVHGYAGSKTSCPNTFELKYGELIWFAAATVVMHSRTSGTQRFYFGHDNDVTCLAIHPDGVHVASGQVPTAGSKANPIRVWNSGSSTVIANDKCALPVHTSAVSCLAFSSDGRLLVSVGDDSYVSGVFAETFLCWLYKPGLRVLQVPHSCNFGLEEEEYPSDCPWA